jgi:hormone-sensitive lipase
LKDGANDVDRAILGRPLKHSPSQPTFSTFSNNSSTQFGSPPSYAKIKEEEESSPMALFHHMPLAKNPYLSPLLATDEQLDGLCPVYLVVSIFHPFFSLMLSPSKLQACQLDPILDDSVMFARRLRALKQPVHLDILPDLPHGFLNFALVSPEAKKASELCVSRMLEVLELDDVTSLLSSEDPQDSDLQDSLDPTDCWEGVHGDPDELLR